MTRPNKKLKRVLFLLKEHTSSGNGPIAKSGLLNSVTLLIAALKHFNVVKDAESRICIDANEIDKYVTEFKPDVCCIEAIWVTGKKLAEIQRLHKKVIFVIRVHSNIPFLAMEGSAIERLFEYFHIPNVIISFNNEHTDRHFKTLMNSHYLPNVYWAPDRNSCDIVERTWVNIGCFGSIRPLKNQLLQAVAAINWAYDTNHTIHFHINSSRVEQAGENCLKNIRALFENSIHKLIEHPWMSHYDFLKIVSMMDLGLQVSLTESFNIVTADFVSSEVPIIVSPDISWMPSILQVEPTDAVALEQKIERVLQHPRRFVRNATTALESHNEEGIKEWGKFLKV